MIQQLLVLIMEGLFTPENNIGQSRHCVHPLILESSFFLIFDFLIFVYGLSFR